MPCVVLRSPPCPPPLYIRVHRRTHALAAHGGDFCARLMRVSPRVSSVIEGDGRAPSQYTQTDPGKIMAAALVASNDEKDMISTVVRDYYDSDNALNFYRQVKNMMEPQKSAGSDTVSVCMCTLAVLATPANSVQTDCGTGSTPYV